MLNHTWSVYNNLPTKLFLYKHKLLGSTATWVPNSTPVHFRMGPSSVSCALLSLETNESYHRCMQEQDWLLWEPPGQTWVSCLGGAGVCHWQGGTGTWCFRETDPDFHLILPSSKKFSASANLLLYRDIFFYITTLKILIINVLLQKIEVNTDDVFQELIFPYILASRLTFQWLLFKLTTAELQNAVFVLTPMTENFICIQMPTGLWYFNNKTAGLKAHDEKSD